MTASPTDERDILTPAQRARVAALRASRAVQQHTGGGFASGSTPPEVTDLVAVARFILDGHDPWAAIYNHHTDNSTDSTEDDQ